jgi:hypothetical protein
MAEIQGLGKCGICYEPIQDAKTGAPSAIRHLRGHQLAHKTCADRQAIYEQTQEYRVEQAKQAIETAEQKVNAANYELEVARLKLKQAEASVD